MLKLARPFQNSMILQRNKPVKVWGGSDCDDCVSVILNHSEIMQIEVGAGDFTFNLPAQPAMRDASLVFQTRSGQTIRFQNIDFGDVWIAGGQSNMEFTLRFDVEGKQTAASADDLHIRYYEVGKYRFDGEREEGLRDASHWEQWMTFCPENAPYFSAVAAYFALKVREYSDVPLGMIGCNFGGTTASTWLDEQYLSADQDLQVFLENYQSGLKSINLETYDQDNRKERENEASPSTVKYMDQLMSGSAGWFVRMVATLMTKASSKKALIFGPRHQNRPGGLYHHMLTEISGYSCCGVIWYQGETDDHFAQVYAKLFTALIACWRRDWHDELPFLFVQLAPFESWIGLKAMNYPGLRKQQERVANSVPKTWMASIMDSGNRDDIHPKNKRPVGERLGLLALKYIYGMEVDAESPQFRSAERAGDSICLRFNHAYHGVSVRGGQSNEWEVIADGKKIPVSVRAHADMVELLANGLASAKKIEIRFAETNFCVVNLINSTGLPARPFSVVL
jgi:sialate O-acetylesterase